MRYYTLIKESISRAMEIVTALPIFVPSYSLGTERPLFVSCCRADLYMLTSKLLNPHLLSLLARVRHTNTLVIADRGFPFWTEIETVDISLMDDVPTVLQVLGAVRTLFQPAAALMAREFLDHNSAETCRKIEEALQGIPTQYEPHVEFKQRVPKAIGLIRTGDTTVGSSRVDLQACKLEYSIVSPK